VGFCAAALAFGRVASVLQSIESLLAVMGPEPARFVRNFEPVRDSGRIEPLVHRWIRGRDLVALLIILQRMLRSSGSLEEFFLEGDDPSSPDIAEALDRFCRRALDTDLREAYGGGAEAARGLLLLPASVAGQRMQAAESFPALDGQARHHRPGRMDPRVTGAADRTARHARHPPRPLPSPDDVCEPGMEDGGADYGVTARDRSGDPVRFDFSLCHVGMMQACGYERPQGDRQCPLRGLCHPRARAVKGRQPRRKTVKG
jgi:hypothetical protein